MYFPIWSKVNLVKLFLEKVDLLIGYPYQFSSARICLGMTLQTCYEVELFSNTLWETPIGEVLHWVTWLVCNIQTKTQFLSHFLKDRIYRGIWFSLENMAIKFSFSDAKLHLNSSSGFGVIKNRRQGEGGRGGCTTTYIHLKG